MIIALQALLLFRETLISVIEQFLGPYYRKLSLSLKFKGDEENDDDESDDHVYAEYDDEKGVVFYPPVYAQRYAAVADCLMDERWSGSLEKVVDLGYHDMSFIKYLKDVPGIKRILGVDIESVPLRCSSDLLGCDNYLAKRENPLQVTLFQGNAADPDYRLIGCDAVVAIEMIEHMLPHDLERLIHTVFGFIKPRVAIFTTPNGDFNVLFKALEKNGLRRLDHMFEWGREQFHDWCSNIVTRYPDYTVTTKGIGPGPTDTLHLGCCSQLALFVAKDYTKQPDLDLNSLALVAKTSSLNNLSHIVGSWESIDSTIDNNIMLYAPPSVVSYPELMYEEPSCITIVLSTPPYSMDAVGCKDKILQCNLDSEFGKSFLMFDDEVYFNVMAPRRKKFCRIYEIEDVANRLNSSTFLVKKFSKATQGLMAKNKIESYAHTREIVNEIRQLKKMLNFNKDCIDKDYEGTWCNINWGMNAPYWNQYYRIVREYMYPFEAKTDETRIVDLVTEEINRLIDTEYDEEIASDVQKLEIPIGQLMPVVEHITTDVDKVKELLEWNGYDVVGDLVIHSRLIVDNISEISQDDDWQEDTISDWDTTEVHSTSLSDGSTIVPDYYGLRLRRGIDQKVRKLRTLLTTDKDITTELDCVVCRLMKLALSTSKGRQKPPPISWMQCKLFDLLTLTEKSIERRRLQKYSFKAIEYRKEIISLDEIKMGDTHRGQMIVSRYQDFSGDFQTYNNNDLQVFDNSEYEDYNISANSNEFKDEFLENKENQEEPSSNIIVLDVKEVNTIRKTIHIEQTGELNLVPYPNTKDLISSGDSNCSTSNGEEIQLKSLEDYYVISLNDQYMIKNTGVVEMKNNRLFKKRKNHSFESKYNIHNGSISKINKKVLSRRSSNINYDTFDAKKTKSKDKKKTKERHVFKSCLSKSSRPIPASLIELCHSLSNKQLEKIKPTNHIENEFNQSNNMAIEDFEGDKEDGENLTPMRHNIGISHDLDLDILEDEDELRTVINLSQDNSYCGIKVDTENLQSQTIFLNDLDEPSTSKGVRHLSTDVQCGPDVTMECPMMSQTTSLTRMPKFFSSGIRIGEPRPDIKVKKNTYDFGTCTELCDNMVKIDRTTVGIKIKELIPEVAECFTMTQVIDDKTTSAQFISRTETKLLKPVCSELRTEDSGSEFCGSIGSFNKSRTGFIGPSKNVSDFHMQSVSNEKSVVVKISQTSYDRTTSLACGGVHVHSFKERQVSEDVVYQGEWQRRKELPKRNNSYFVKNKILLPKRTKVLKEHSKTKVDDVKRCSTKPIKDREPSHKKIQNKKKYSNNPKQISNNASVKKVSSKPVVLSSHVSKNMKTIYTTKKRTNVTSALETKIKQEEKRQENKPKNYLPLYLRRRMQVKKNNFEIKIKNEMELKSNRNIQHEDTFAPFSIAEVTKDLIKMPEESVLTTNITQEYMVFCNDIQTENDSNIKLSTATGLIKSDNFDRSHSPPSQHSSTCSSPNSVATVRAVSAKNKVTCNRRNSTSSERSSSGLLESENKAAKNKKFSRRSKSTKKPSIITSILCDNKENMPESSQNTMTPDKDKSSKSMFLGCTKSVFMAKISADSTNLPLSPLTVSKTKMQSLTKPLKLTNCNTSTENQSYGPPCSSILKASLDETSINEACNENSNISLCDNKLFTYEIIKESSSNNIFKNEDCPIQNDVDDDSVNSHSIHKTKRSIIYAIRKIIENKLNQPESSYDHSDSDSETVILSRDDDYINKCNYNYSHTSTKNFTDETYGSESNVDYSLVHCPSTVQEKVPSDVDLKTPGTESDATSLKSFGSMSTSKFSEYYLADNELELAVPQVDNTHISSIQDIFERKELNTMPKVGGLLAVQAFSGFSVNEPIAGDQPDFVNFIDSETGSFAFQSARQATSEEIFVSGRSSDTYESCYVDHVDEDSYVPSWLFNMMSQQQSAEESEDEEVNLPFQMPIEEPGYDMNGNIMEPGIGVGAGAGDGRGIHSDQSQDSSGRGTSLSSSETSSGPQSEAILIDPSHFTAQVDYLRDPVSVSAMIGPSRPHVSTVSNAGENNRAATLNQQVTNPRNLINPVQIASDVDADVSSLETDAVDSDN